MPDPVRLTFNIANFNLRSSWTTRANGTNSWPSTASATKSVSVYGIPDDATINSATLYVRCGTGYGGARVLKVNGHNLTPGASNEVSFTSSVTANGVYNFTFQYQDYGVVLSEGSHYGSMGFRDIALIVIYTPGEDAPEEDEPGDDFPYPESDSICLYDPDETDYSSNGLGILNPSSCIVREEAGGEYEAELQIPADGDLWQLIDVESIIKIPVPVTTVEAFQSAGAAYWKVKSNYASAPVKSKVPTITYNTSGATPFEYTTYSKGAKVTSGGAVYQYVGYCAFTFTGDPSTNKNWVKITPSVSVNSGKTLATLPRGAVFTKLSDVNSSWMRVKTSDGVEGYMEKKYGEYYAEVGTASAEREIRNQCFRVYRIVKDSATNQVTVNARHLSYDFARTPMGRCEAKGISPANAISMMESAALYEDNRQILTNINDKTVDIDASWDNGVSALLSPDTGIVAQLQAKLIRDNEDFIILADNHTDRGFTLRYGKNLRAVQWSIDTSSMATRIVPHCKDSSGNDLLLPNQCVDSPLIDQYPVIYVEALDVNCQEGKKGIVNGTTVNSLTKANCYTIMTEDAEKRFNVDHADEPEIEIDIDMLMLGTTEEYKQYADLEILYMYDTVHVYHPILGLEVAAYMTGYEYDAILRRYRKIRLTNARRKDATSVSGYNLRNNSIKFEKLASTAIDRIKG